MMSRTRFTAFFPARPRQSRSHDQVRRSLMKRFTKGRVHRALVPHTRITRAIVAVVCAGLFTTACDVHGVSNPGTLTTFSISPLTQTLGINGTQQFTAVGSDFAGVNVPVNPVWTVVTGGGAINASGMFTAGTT